MMISLLLESYNSHLLKDGVHIYKLFRCRCNDDGVGSNDDDDGGDDGVCEVRMS